MILLKILEHDLYKGRGMADEARVLRIETPAKPEWFPVVISSLDSEKFLVSRKIHKDNMIHSGVFSYDPDRLDDILLPMFNTVYDLSVEEKWNNIKNDPFESFKYIQKRSGIESQPHILLVPDDMSDGNIAKMLGKNNIKKYKITGDDKEKHGAPTTKYREICKIFHSKVKRPVFLSKPDFVGLYTQIVGGMTSIVLHNIKNGISFFNI